MQTRLSRYLHNSGNHQSLSSIIKIVSHKQSRVIGQSRNPSHVIGWHGQDTTSICVPNNLNGNSVSRFISRIHIFSETVILMFLMRHSQRTLPLNSWICMDWKINKFSLASMLLKICRPSIVRYRLLSQSGPGCQLNNGDLLISRIGDIFIETRIRYWIPISKSESHKFSFQYKHDFIWSKYYSNDNNNINTKPRRSKTDLAPPGGRGGKRFV